MHPLSNRDVIVEIDGEDVRELSGDDTKAKLRQIGAVVTFVLVSKDTLLERAGGVDGEYDSRTHPDAAGADDFGLGSGSDEGESSYAVRVAPPAEGGGGADGVVLAKKKPPPVIKKRSASVKVPNSRPRQEGTQRSFSVPKSSSGANPFDNLVAADEVGDQLCR